MDQGFQKLASLQTFGRLGLPVYIYIYICRIHIFWGYKVVSDIVWVSVCYFLILGSHCCLTGSWWLEVRTDVKSGESSYFLIENEIKI